MGSMDFTPLFWFGLIAGLLLGAAATGLLAWVL
jgi:hypothetical protein